MATTAFSSKVLLGASKPLVSLIGGAAQLQKLTGTWTWTEGSATVTVDEDLTDIVIVNDRLKAFSNGKFWTVNTISYSDGTGVTTITLSASYDESPDLVSNGDFASWTAGDDPVDWTVQNEAGSDIVTEVSGACNIIDTTGGLNVGIFQTIFTVDQRYKVTLDVDDVTAGGIVVGLGNRHKAFNGTGAGEWIAVAATTKLLIRSRYTVPSDVTFDDVVAIRYSTEGFIDRSGRVELPHTSDTLYEFIPERNDGGATFVTLESGETVARHDGYRVRITLSWLLMIPFEFKKIIQIRNWTGTGQVLLTPHEDVLLQFDVLPAASLTPGNPGDLFLGHAVTETYVSRKLITNIPTAAAVGSFHPIVF